MAEKPEEKILMDDDVKPAAIDDAEVRLPEALPGDLPENHAREPQAERPARDGVIRMPEATVEALDGAEQAERTHEER